MGFLKPKENSSISYTISFTCPPPATNSEETEENGYNIRATPRITVKLIHNLAQVCRFF